MTKSYLKTAASVAALLATIVIASPAGAATIDLTGMNYDLDATVGSSSGPGTVLIGQTGTINNAPFMYNSESTYASGYLPAYTQITLNYSLSNGLTFTNSNALTGAVEYLNNGVSIGEAGVDNVIGNYSVTRSFATGTLTATSTQVSPTLDTILLVNNTAQTNYFLALIEGNTGGSSSATYKVAGVSPVPLPASAWMFMMALMALGVVGYRNRARG